MTPLLIIGALGGIALSGLVSAAETGSYCLNRVRLRVRQEQSDPAARRLAALIEQHEDLLMLTLLGNTLADYVCTACVTALLIGAQFTGGQAEIYATAIVTPLLLVLGGIVPKDWFRRDADRLMYPVAGPLLVGVRLARVTGFLWAMRVLTRWLVRRIDPLRLTRTEDPYSRTHVLRLLHEATAAGRLTPFQRDLMERVMNLSAVRVTAVMIPLRRAATVSRSVRREDFLRAARMAHFSRFPVYADRSDRIVGIVNVYDVLTDPAGRPIADHVRPALTLEPAEPVSSALLKMQNARQAMAIVTDRTGACLGILTIKDLVEEIVGDLAAW